MVDWKVSAQSLAEFLGKAAASAVLRTAIVVGLSLGPNLAFALTFYASSGIAGGLGRPLGIAISMLCFAPFVVLAVVIVMRLAAATQ
jgi:uncharacterized membrane protein